MAGPDSSYSCLLIHLCWKLDKWARMEPLIHVEYLHSDAMTLILFIVGGANAVIFLHPVNNSWEHGTSSREDDVGIEILMDVNVSLHDGVVTCLLFTRDGWNKTSGQQNHLLPMVIT